MTRTQYSKESFMNKLKKMPTTKAAIQKMVNIEEIMAQFPGARFDDDTSRLEHTFGDGLYTRKIFMNKGDVIVSKIHKTTHPYFVLLGECLVWDGEKRVRIKAPYHGITKAGTKRVLFILEDCVWATVHATEETDLEKIEEQIIAKNYDELVSKEQICLGVQ